MLRLLEPSTDEGHRTFLTSCPLPFMGRSQTTSSQLSKFFVSEGTQGCLPASLSDCLSFDCSFWVQPLGDSAQGAATMERGDFRNLFLAFFFSPLCSYFVSFPPFILFYSIILKHSIVGKGLCSELSCRQVPDSTKFKVVTGLSHQYKEARTWSPSPFPPHSEPENSKHTRKAKTMAFPKRFQPNADEE